MNTWEQYLADLQEHEVEWSDLPPERIQWICEDATLELVSYTTYLQTSIWKKIRGEALDHYGGSCVLCGNVYPINVHHRRYPPRGTETVADLIVLCRDCHKSFHETLAP